MLRRSIVLAIATTTIAGCGSKSQSPALEERVNAQVVAKLREEGLERSQVMDTLGSLTEVFSSRLTGSPSLKDAQNWATKRLTDYGLEDAHLEAWGPFGRGWALKEFTASVVEPHFWRLVAFPRAWSPSTDGPVHREVTYLDAETEADLEKYTGMLRGAVVMISPPRGVKVSFSETNGRHTEESLLQLSNADPKRHAEALTTRAQQADKQHQHEMWIKKLKLCHTERAAIILEASSKYDGGTVFVRYATNANFLDIPYERRPRPWDKEAPATIPQVDVAVEDYNRLVRMLERGIHPKIELNITSEFYDDDLMSYNVLAEIPGTDLKHELVMLGAHIDSVHGGTGATDNAAGVAVCMEAVRMLKAIDVKPRRTIRIGLWSGEEQVMLGSQAYVSQHFASRSDKAEALKLKPEHAKLAGYFNLDYGTGKIRGVYLQGNEGVRPIFRAWLAPFNDMGATTLSILPFGSDNSSFNNVGLPGFDFIQDPIEYETRTHHSNMDLYDRVQADDLKQAAIIMASFVYHSAMRDELLPRRPMPMKVADE